MEKISWNSVAKITVIIVVIFACCAAWKWFFKTSGIPTIPSDIVWTTNPQNINAQENYKATYDLFDSHFNQLISLFALFGIVVPIGAYLLQSKSIKEERERMEKSLNEKIKEIDEIRKKAVDGEITAKKAQMDAEKSLKMAQSAKKQLNAVY